MATNPVAWFEIYVEDMERAKKFYEAMLQVKLQKIESEVLELWAFPQSTTTYGASGALARMEGMRSGGNSTIIYFACEDCAVEAKRGVAAGGRILKDKFSIGKYGFIALGFDTKNNLFGLHSMK